MNGFFEKALSGGHPNSLGNTVKVVDTVLADESRFAELFACYFSEDPVVRLRVSNAMKRIAKEKPHLLIQFIDRFLTEVARIDQASAKWTLAQLFLILERKLTLAQKEQATKIMKSNLKNQEDWIVLNQTMNTLGKWAKKDEDLKRWLLPVLKQRSGDNRKSVTNTATKWIEQLAK